MHIRNMARSGGIASVLTASLVLAGCGDHVVVSPTGDVETALSRWAEFGAPSYTFVIDSTCGDGRLLGMYEVTVDNGEVTDLQPIDAAAEESGARPSSALTIDDVFTEIGAIRLNEVDALEANYHIRDGYPTYFAVDPDENTDNDETCYTISSVQPD